MTRNTKCALKAFVVLTWGACSLTLLSGGPANAALIPVTLLNTPDILVQNIDVTYDSGSQTLTQTGIPVQIDDGSIHAISGGSYSLSAPIDSSGDLIDLSGTISVLGTVPDLGWNSGTIISGTVRNFGWQEPNGTIMDFLITVTGGDWLNLYQASSGAISSQINNFGDWNTDWNNLILNIPGSGSAVADIGVPEPSSFLLATFAMLLLAGAGWRRRLISSRA